MKNEFCNQDYAFLKAMCLTLSIAVVACLIIIGLQINEYIKINELNHQYEQMLNLPQVKELLE